VRALTRGRHGSLIRPATQYNAMRWFKESRFRGQAALQRGPAIHPPEVVIARPEFLAELVKRVVAAVMRAQRNPLRIPPRKQCNVLCDVALGRTPERAEDDHLLHVDPPVRIRPRGTG